ncbi:MAG TPA: N-acetylglucosamine-6-phosphate deacetylase [Bacteroides sp.]|nr:N-acetylglucosamine-6-phosphate deacetylase [Bacteroides sp.]
MKNYFITAVLSLIIGGCSAGPDEGAYLIHGIRYSDGVPVSVSVNEGGIITRVEPIRDNTTTHGLYISPGLIDLQINGYKGVDFTDTTLTLEDMITVTRALWETGVTQYLPTVITSSDEILQACFSRLSKYIEDPRIARSIPGFHLEGPYISPVQGFRGAHLEKYIRPANWDEFRNYQALSGNKILLVTVAPEFEENITFIQKAAVAGILVSLGHHNAGPEVVHRAVEAGARLSTHLGNGCANEINRHHNPLWPQLSNDSLSISIIADGYHLTRDEVRTFYSVKGDEKTILVSDALDLAGLPPGEYIRGERKILLTPHVAKYPAEDVLAGAASPMKRCVMQMMQYTGCSLKSVVHMASRNPGRLMGLGTGELLPGRRADLIIFEFVDEEMVIRETYVAGEQVYKKSD